MATRSKPRVPRVGPYATRTFNAATRQWRVSLTDEGRALVESFLAQWPRVTGYLYKMVPGAVSFVKAVNIPAEDVEAAARAAVVAAVVRMDPARVSPKTGRPAQLSTVVGFALRAAWNTLAAQWVGPAGLAQLDGGAAVAAGTGTGVGVGTALGTAEYAAPVDPVRGPDLSVLPVRERWVVTLRYGLGGGPVLTLAEIGKVIRVTRERVRQLLCAALVRLRRALESECLHVLVCDHLAVTPEAPATLIARALRVTTPEVEAVLRDLCARHLVAPSGRTHGRKKTMWKLTAVRKDPS
jgi:DNA-binding MarR family transcriptional regulator